MATWAVLISVTAKPARSSGVYEEFGRFFTFVLAPQAYSIDGHVALTGAPDNEASVFTLSTNAPHQSWILVQPEISYVSKTTPTEVFNSAGDAMVRVRVRLWHAPSVAVHVLPAVRLGTGTAELFPYSTASIDIELGLAVVDTIGSRAGWWASGSAIYPTRVQDQIKEGHLYGNWATGGLGVILMPGSRWLFKGGGMALYPAGHRTRQIYFADLDFSYSAHTTWYLTSLVEGGTRDNRAVDYSAGFGIRVTF